jgi:hypothetical protein
MRAAFLDPPYLGCGERYYGCLHESASDCDSIEWHADLIGKTHAEYDGWAYCLSSVSMQKILPLCPDCVRVAAWVKPWAVFRPNVNPAYCWEPVIFHTTAQRTRQEDTVRDWCAENITMKKGLVGAKPPGFCRWVIDLLGLRRGDELVDVFPGTGVMGDVWDSFNGVYAVQGGLFDE